jgi:predicted phosphoribosyltransferase
MHFIDREDAAQQLFEKLLIYQDQKPIVLGIPRGAIPMAKIIADGLHAELNVVLVHKIPAPLYEEFAIASIGLSGHIERMNYIQNLHIPESYIEQEGKKQLAILKARQKQYGLSAPNCYNRVVIIVDDGIATGATTLAAVYEIRHQQPKKIILATPVSAEDSYHILKKEVDDIVVLSIPPYFQAVGQFYDEFEQVRDEEVIQILSTS